MRPSTRQWRGVSNVMSTRFGRSAQLGDATVGVDGEAFEEEEEIEDGANLDVCPVVKLNFEDVIDATLGHTSVLTYVYIIY